MNHYCDNAFSSTAKSPIFNQMSASITGISTIRANKASKRLAHEFDNLQNVHSSVWQILTSVNTGVCCKAINDEHGKYMPRRKIGKVFTFFYFLFMLGMCAR